ncbi:hypothetical protein RH831_10560 [Halodesulfurarchaeum sp. HSR-GB]|uniref:hypothetical protein n=1 Tax=Halodesulfurarchaeum sp. HSR-GB TaxID=3074077 RepID=UPI0028582B8B|nr:hypothetical protein [Halodesulfurarchaeum sp. HSR-GB]MDR5657618.1 hypothetical protein [Halodesulfurarchaeum sp. HSR-GB]
MSTKTKQIHGDGKYVDEYIKIVPTEENVTDSQIAQQIKSLRNFKKDIEGGVLAKRFGKEEPLNIALHAYSEGEDEPVELYFGAEDDMETLDDRLREIYPSSWSVEWVKIDPQKLIHRPVELDLQEFQHHLTHGNLLIDAEDFAANSVVDKEKDEEGDGAESDGSNGPLETNDPSSKPASDDETQPVEGNYTPSPEEGAAGVQAFESEAETELPNLADDVDVESTIYQLDPASNIPQDGTRSNLNRPTLTGDGTVYARLGKDATAFQGVRWFGIPDRKNDWMTTLGPGESHLSDVTGEKETSEDVTVLNSLFNRMTDMAEPVMVQIIFRAKKDWSKSAEKRKNSIRKGEDTFGQKILSDIAVAREKNSSSSPSDEDSSSEDDSVDYSSLNMQTGDFGEVSKQQKQRLDRIDAKEPEKTFSVNIRAISARPILGPLYANRTEEDQQHELRQLSNLLDPLEGRFYNIEGELVLDDSGAKATDGGIVSSVKGKISNRQITPLDVYDRILDWELLSEFDKDPFLERLKQGKKKQPEIVMNAIELSSVFIIPSGDKMSREAYRMTHSTQMDSRPLTPPKPKLLNQFKNGMAIGHPVDQQGSPQDKPVELTEDVLNTHYARFAASGAGKTVATINDILSLHRNIGGPTILIDPKGGDMCPSYLRAHFAQFGTLQDVHYFKAPENIPAIPFFDIRPLIAGRMDREDAIQHKVDHFHEVMAMIMGEDYERAYVGRMIITYLIKALFDRKTAGNKDQTDDNASPESGGEGDNEQDADGQATSHSPEDPDNDEKGAYLFDEGPGDESEEDPDGEYIDEDSDMDDLLDQSKLYEERERGPDYFGFNELYSAAKAMLENEEIPSTSTPDQPEMALERHTEQSDRDFQQTMSAVINRLDKIRENIHIFKMFQLMAHWDEENDKYVYEHEETGDERPVLDFAEFFDEDAVILFDIGDLRNESQRAMTVTIASQLWAQLKANRRRVQGELKEDSPQVNLIIEEAKDVIVSDLFRSDIIPEAREFDLSLGLIMQYPEQAKHETGDKGLYSEIMNDIQAKMFGKIMVEDRVAESITHGVRNETSIRNKIQSLPKGRWIADLPAPTYGMERPSPFSISGLEIPLGHPKHEREMTKAGYNVFKDQRRKSFEKTHKELALGPVIDFDEAEPEEGAPGVSRQTKAREGDKYTSDLKAQSRISGKPKSPDADITERKDFDDTGEHSGAIDNQLTEDVPTKGAGTSNTKDETPSENASGAAIPAQANANQPANQGPDVDAEEGGSFGKEDREEVNNLQEDYGGADQHETTDPNEGPKTGGSDSFTDDNSSEPETQSQPKREKTKTQLGIPRYGDTFKFDDESVAEEDILKFMNEFGEGDPHTTLSMISRLEFSAEGWVELIGVYLDQDDDRTIEDLSELPEGYELDTVEDELDDKRLGLEDPEVVTAEEFPIQAINLEGNDLSGSQAKFLIMIGRAVKGNLDDYDLLDSMKDLPERAGGPDLDDLEDRDFIQREKLQSKYFTLLPKGWKAIPVDQPTNPGEGDWAEHTPHRVIVETLKRYYDEKMDFDIVMKYYRIGDSVFDLFAAESLDDDAKNVIAEIEMDDNDHKGTMQDYHKMAARSGAKSLWVFKSSSEAKKIVNRILEELDEEQLSTEDTRSITNMNEALEERSLPGLNEVMTFHNLKQEVKST